MAREIKKAAKRRRANASPTKGGGDGYIELTRQMKRGRRANAEPAGGGGGGWKAMNESMARNRAKRRGGGPTWNTGEWGQGRIAEGDIAGGMAAESSGTSIFDPVLCELSYRWYCPPGGLVLDPFAGGSVRGIVASRLGRKYLGVDLRPEQILANEGQAEIMCGPPMPEWKAGDSRDLLALAEGAEADFIFSCPPYADLEVYSDDPRDISTLDYPDFLAAYRAIIEAACRLLRPDRFACFVVGDVRDAGGLYRGLPWHTIQAFEDAGLRLYNEAVLVTAVGSLPIRVRRQFEVGRKLGKTHQNVLVFVKGDPRAAAAAVGAVEFGEPVAAEAGVPNAASD